MKKWVAGMNVIIMAAGVGLTGCGAGESASGPAAAGGKGEEAAKPAAPKGPVKFSAFISGSGIPTPDKDFILQQLNKDLNMEMEFNVPTSDYNQQLNVKMAGGTPPDLFSVTKDQLQQYAQQGLLLELDKYLDKMPNIKKIYSESDLNKGRLNGKLYAIAKRPYIPMGSYWFRKDWLDKLGLQPPQTLDDFKKVLVAFTNQDPDGNGKKDTYGLTGNGWSSFEGIFAAYGIGRPGQWMIVDNKVVYTSTDPKMKAAMTYIQELVSLGVMDPEMMANKNRNDLDKAFKGTAGALYKGWGDIMKDNEVENWKKINPNADWLQSDSLTGPGGKIAGIWDEGGTPGRQALSKSLEKQPEKLNKILEYLNYITEPDKGQTIVNYGIEGTHYKMENGKMVLLPAIADTGYAWQVQLTGRNELDYLKTKFPKQEKYIDFASKLPLIKVYNEFVPLPQGVVVDDKNRYETEEMTKFMYGKRPLAEFDAFTETLNKTYQLPLYVKEAEKSLKELGYLK